MNPTHGVVGVDPSLAATGYADTLGQFTFKQKPGYGRLNNLLGDFEDRLAESVSITRAQGQELVAVIEDLPQQARAAGLTGMAQGVIRAVLEAYGVQYATISPASLKKFATDNGRASKDDMAAAMAKHHGSAPRDDNQVDAWWLRELGLQLLDHPERAHSHQLATRARAAKTKGWPL